MGLSFERDPQKAVANHKEHGVGFGEAETIFADPRSLDRPDPDHSCVEERWIKSGISERLRVLVVVYTEGLGPIRIISARKANRRERQEYEKGFQ